MLTISVGCLNQSENSTLFSVNLRKTEKIHELPTSPRRIKHTNFVNIRKICTVAQVFVHFYIYLDIEMVRPLRLLPS